jgi:hypothetical protein
MQALKINDSERGAVLRVACSRVGLAELAAAAGYAGVVVGELVDDADEICGRVRRSPDPLANRYGPGLCWHVQIGGVLASRVWAACPMGCGAGDTIFEAASAAVANLSEQADRRAAAARQFSGFFFR